MTFASPELLLECESSFGVRLPADLAESGGLTVGRVVTLLREAVDGQRNEVNG